jgi:predicted RNase H-like HicB family nuclease
MNATDRYSMVVEWSDEDGVYVVSLPEWGRFARTHGATHEEAVRAGREVLELLVEDARACGQELPPPRVYATPAV